MAGAAQWTIEQLYAQLQKLKDGARHLTGELAADKAQLTALWSRTKTDANAARRAQNQALLQPLIHQNSVLRLSYLAPIVEKFNAAVAAASKALKAAGYAPPTLAGGDRGLGFAVVIAPIAAVTVAIAAIAIAATAIALTRAQRANTASVARLIGDPTTTPAEKIALLKAITEEQRAAAEANRPAGFSFEMLVPALGLVALIVLGPRLMAILPSRRAA